MRIGSRTCHLAAATRRRTPLSCSAARPRLLPAVPRRVALTVAGHLHGGQVNVPLLRRAVLPTRYGERYLPATWSRTAATSTSRRASAPRACRCACAGRPSSPCCGSEPPRPASRLVTCSSLRPLAGSVRTSSVGARPGRRPCLAALVERVVDPGERPVAVRRVTRSRRASSGARRRPRPGQVQVRPPARQAEQPRQVLLRPLLPAGAPDALERAASRLSSGRARSESKWGMPSTAVASRPAGGAAAKPNRDITPSTSTSSKGRLHFSSRWTLVWVRSALKEVSAMADDRG